ncbi:MAG TPA: SDR family oxidoreductase [Streptosporangiaceae bacterium]|nr:SDR family oxidoreductase [Streptosporangiaceae bacterium]
MSLTGRIALVSGGSRGIGRAIALRLAADGAQVAVNYRRDEAAAQATCEAIKAVGGHARAYRASVDSLPELESMVRELLADFGAVDILVSNAGIASRGKNVADTDPAELERVVSTHAFGAFYLSQLLLPQMRGRPRGDIVVVSSTAARTPMPGGAPYMMAKAALEALAATLAVEEMRHGIHTNIVAPGLVRTDMGDRLARALANVQDAAELNSRSPYGRVCRPQDVADVVAYLVSDQAAYLNGQRIAVNGGGSALRELR